MKAPLNTDNWSGSIKSSKAPLNTDDWNGFISADMSRKLSQNCQCIKAPCNCGVINNVPTLPPKTVNDAIANESIVDENSILTYAESLEKDKKLKQRHTILFALLIVGGFIAYKKFKK